VVSVLKIINFFLEAAPIELVSVKIARTVEKLIMVLLKLEIPIIVRVLWGFGKLSFLIGSYWKRWDPLKALTRARVIGFLIG
jgi:hypothetical protein